MGAPTVYRWDDDEAPVLLPQNNNPLKLLKACLVDGYGEKPGAGWTCPYDNLETVEHGTIVLRGNADTGTGMFYRFSPCAIPLQSSWYLEGFESMTSMDEGITRWPNLSALPSTYYFTQAGYEAEPRAWMIIADDRCAYMCTWIYPPSQANGDPYNPVNDLVYAQVGFIGDFISEIPGDNYAAAMIIPWPNQSYGGYFGRLNIPQTPTQGFHYTPRWSDGATPDPVEVNNTFCLIATGLEYKTSGGNVQFTNLPHPFHGKTIISRPIVNDGTACSFRGYLPGFHATPHYVPFEYMSIFTDDTGKDYQVVGARCYQNDKCQFLVDLSEDFRP